LSHRKIGRVLRCVTSIARNNGKQSICNTAMHSCGRNREFARSATDLCGPPRPTKNPAAFLGAGRKFPYRISPDNRFAQNSQEKKQKK